MKFWCNACEVVFDAEPTSDEFDQSNCLQCGFGCLSYEIELEDARKAQVNNQVAGSLLSVVLGIFTGPAAGALSSGGGESAILRHNRITGDEPEFLVLRTEEAALLVRDELGTHGIICGIEKHADDKFEIVVDKQDKSRAIRIVEHKN